MTKKKSIQKEATSLKECDELSEQQKEFCHYYVNSRDFNISEAMIKAGYSEKSAYSCGSRMLKNAKIKKYVDELMEEKAKEHNITHQQLIEDLIEIKDRCMQAKPVTFMGKHIQDENGNNLWKFDAKGATKAIELIGRHTGFFLEDNKQKQPIVNPVQNTYVTPKECKDAIQHIKDFVK